MGKTLPIKDIEIINQIKDLYLKQKNYRDLLLFLLGINTGANLCDLLNLNVSDVKGKYNLVFKNKCSIPLNDEIRELIDIVTEKKKLNAPLFMNKIQKRIDRSRVFHNFKRIRRELALSDEISVASFRKTFGYFHYQKYKDLSFLQWLFNQDGVEKTLSYIDVKENINLRFREGVCL